MKKLMAERFKEVEHFRKLNNASWGNPNMYAQDIEKVKAIYDTKLQDLRQKHAQEQEKYVQGNKSAETNQSEVQGENNPVDRSKISDYSKFKAIKQRTEELMKDEQKKKRYPYRRR